MTMRVFSPIETACPEWPQARFVILSFLPDELEFEARGNGIIAISTDFVRPILESIPGRRTSVINQLTSRFTWIAKCLPMTLPTDVELQHFYCCQITPALMARIRDTMRQHQQTRADLCLPTAMQLFRHGLGIAKCPFPIDPDW